jgi:hypothetical protein
MEVVKMKDVVEIVKEKKIRVKTTEVKENGKPRFQMVVPFKAVPFQPVTIIRKKSGEEIRKCLQLI